MDDNGLQNGMQGGEQLEKPMSLGDWIITIIVLGIPCVGVVMMFVWGFGQGNMSRRNYCRATLILAAIASVFMFIFSATISQALVNALGSY